MTIKCWQRILPTSLPGCYGLNTDELELCQIPTSRRRKPTSELITLFEKNLVKKNRTGHWEQMHKCRTWPCVGAEFG